MRGVFWGMCLSDLIDGVTLFPLSYCFFFFSWCSCNCLNSGQEQREATSLHPHLAKLCDRRLPNGTSELTECEAGSSRDAWLAKAEDAGQASSFIYLLNLLL